MATARRTSSLVMGSRSPKGVPGMGRRMFSGMEPIPSAARSNAMSIRSSQVSPMPMMPPEQTESPAACARRMTSSLSSNVCVVQIFGKFLREVSMLWW